MLPDSLIFGRCLGLSLNSYHPYITFIFPQCTSYPTTHTAFRLSAASFRFLAILRFLGPPLSRLCPSKAAPPQHSFPSVNCLLSAVRATSQLPPHPSGRDWPVSPHSSSFLCYMGPRGPFSFSPTTLDPLLPLPLHSFIHSFILESGGGSGVESKAEDDN